MSEQLDIFAFAAANPQSEPVPEPKPVPQSEPDAAIASIYAGSFYTLDFGDEPIWCNLNGLKAEVVSLFSENCVQVRVIEKDKDFYVAPKRLTPWINDATEGESGDPEVRAEDPEIKVGDRVISLHQERFPDRTGEVIKLVTSHTVDEENNLIEIPYVSVAFDIEIDTSKNRYIKNQKTNIVRLVAPPYMMPLSLLSKVI